MMHDHDSEPAIAAREEPLDDQDFHIRRAREEIDRGYRAMSEQASRSHMALAALHMGRARQPD